MCINIIIFIVTYIGLVIWSLNGGGRNPLVGAFIVALLVVALWQLTKVLGTKVWKYYFKKK